MENVQIELKRKNQITNARRKCMLQLNRTYKKSRIQQEKHERKHFGNLQREGQNRHSYGFRSLEIRILFSVLFFLFVFLIREEKISYKSLNYADIQEQFMNNEMIRNIEKYVKSYMVYPS